MPITKRSSASSYTTSGSKTAPRCAPNWKAKAVQPGVGVPGSELVPPCVGSKNVANWTGPVKELPCLSKTSNAELTTTITWPGPTARSGSGGTVAGKPVPWQQSLASIASKLELSLIFGPTGFCEPSKFCTPALFFCLAAAAIAAATCSSLKRDSMRSLPRTGRSAAAASVTRGTSRSWIGEGPSAW